MMSEEEGFQLSCVRWEIFNVRNPSEASGGLMDVCRIIERGSKFLSLLLRFILYFASGVTVTHFVLRPFV